MVFKLDDKDAEASVFGEPEIAPQPQGFPFGGGAPAPRR
jgi:para-nitrobenzyl esterase